jgi:uncharacterized protein YecE (DUF72 family)
MSEQPDEENDEEIGGDEEIGDEAGEDELDEDVDEDVDEDADEATAATASADVPILVGTVDVPARIDRERYFRELSYLELSVLFAGPVNPGGLAKWKKLAPPKSIGLVAPFSLTHRKAPSGAKLWPSDASTGDFRISEVSRAALSSLREAVALLDARYVVFRSAESFSPSAANRDALRRFFAELATPDATGTERVWVPGGLWEPRSAVTFANELGVTCALDPLVHAPGETEDPFEGLEAASLYFRVEGAGRAGAIRNERLEDLAALVESYENVPTTVVFASPERWHDARNFKKLFEG